MSTPIYLTRIDLEEDHQGHVAKIIGSLPNPSWEIVSGVAAISGNTIHITLNTKQNTTDVVAQVLQRFQRAVPLGKLRPGTYVLIINRNDEKPVNITIN